MLEMIAKREKSGEILFQLIGKYNRNQMQKLYCDLWTVKQNELFQMIESGRWKNFEILNSKKMNKSKTMMEREREQKKTPEQSNEEEIPMELHPKLFFVRRKRINKMMFEQKKKN